MKFRVETNAYILSHNEEDFANALRDGDAERIVDSLTFYSVDMSNVWTAAGKATITVEIADENSIRANMAKMLEAERDRILAEAQAKAAVIDAKIQSLLAIEYSAPEQPHDYGF